MIFKDNDTWFGVALEFNLVVEGEDPHLVELELQDAVIGYLESVKKLEHGFRAQHTEGILNQGGKIVHRTLRICSRTPQRNHLCIALLPRK